MNNPQLEGLLEEAIDWRYKGFSEEPAAKIGDIGEKGWRLFGGDILLPIMVLKEATLEHNIRLMAEFCAEHGVFLAPHGKTTMAPQIIERQLAAGAWGITTATVSQARVFRRFGARRVLLANELVDRAGLRWVAQELAEDDEFSFFCLVDSERGVEVMDRALADLAAERTVPVLVELGEHGMRAGTRSDETALKVAEAVNRSGHLRLAGVEAFEGVISGSSMEARRKEVERFLDRVRGFTRDLDARGAFDGTEEILMTGGGSVFFDQVTGLTDVGPLSRPLRVVLRSGCYVTHDHGVYDRGSPFGSASGAVSTFLPALEVWGDVLSTPEPGLAIVGVGKRDAPFDSGLPIPLRVWRRRSGRLEPATGLEITTLNDQHAYVRCENTSVEVGDVLGCGISHPCTAFDKWPLIPLVDDDYRVVGAVKTFF